MLAWGTTIAGLLVCALIAYWMVIGYQQSKAAGVEGFYRRIREGMDGSVTKLFAHGIQIIGWVSLMLPEALELVGTPEAAAAVRTFWPTQASTVMVVISLVTVATRNRSLGRTLLGGRSHEGP